MIAKITNWVKRWHRAGAYVLCLVLIGWAAYNLGQIYAPGALKQPATASEAGEQAKSTTAPKPKVLVDKSDPRVVASKSSSSKKYHHVWCAGAKQIKESNKVWFASAQAAQAAGYSLAGNCSE